MFTSVVVRVEVANSGTVPGTLARAAHAWLLDETRRRDPALSDLLHAPNQERPYSVSDIVWSERGRPTAGRRRDPPGAGTRGEFRITGLDSRMSDVLHDIASHLPGTTLPVFGGVLLRVHDVATRAGEHSASGSTSVDALFTHAMQRGQPNRLVVDFVSPTVFKQKGRFQRTPTPRLAFGAWLRRWNAIQPHLRLDEAFVDQFDSHFRLACCDLERRSVRYARRTIVGSVGRCEYRLGGTDSLRAVAHMLAAFAFWSGTGKSTAWGLGQTRPQSEVLRRSLLVSTGQELSLS